MFFLGSPECNRHALRSSDEKFVIGEEMPEPDLRITRWPLDHSKYSRDLRGGETATTVETMSEPYDKT